LKLLSDAEISRPLSILSHGTSVIFSIDAPIARNERNIGRREADAWSLPEKRIISADQARAANHFRAHSRVFARVRARSRWAAAHVRDLDARVDNAFRAHRTRRIQVDTLSPGWIPRRLTTASSPAEGNRGRGASRSGVSATLLFFPRCNRRLASAICSELGYSICLMDRFNDTAPMLESRSILARRNALRSLCISLMH